MRTGISYSPCCVLLAVVSVAFSCKGRERTPTASLVPVAAQSAGQPPGVTLPTGAELSAIVQNFARSYARLVCSWVVPPDPGRVAFNDRPRTIQTTVISSRIGEIVDRMAPLRVTIEASCHVDRPYTFFPEIRTSEAFYTGTTTRSLFLCRDGFGEWCVLPEARCPSDCRQ